LETETTDLKTEKDLVYQIKKLSGQKDGIKELAAEQVCGWGWGWRWVEVGGWVGGWVSSHTHTH
jgi:hypothetical protein